MVCPGIQFLQFHECCLVVGSEPCKSSSRTTPGVPKVQYPFPFLELLMISPMLYGFPGLFFQSLNQNAGASFTLFCHLLPINAPAFGAKWQEKRKRKKWSLGSCHPLEIKVPLAGEEVSLPESWRCLGHKRKEKRQQKTGDFSQSLWVLGDVLPDPHVRTRGLPFTPLWTKAPFLVWACLKPRQRYQRGNKW